MIRRDPARLYQRILLAQQIVALDPFQHVRNVRLHLVLSELDE